MSRTGRPPVTATFPRLAGTATGFVGITLLLMGCTDDAATVSLPSPSGPTLSSDPPSASARSESEVVKQSYRDFVAMLDQADSLPRETRKKKLSLHMLDPQLSRVLQAIKKHRADNLRTYGSITVHIKSVDIDGSTATVRDCQDSRNSGLRNTVTDEKVSRGVKEGNAKATLKKGADGRWRVSKYTLLGEGC